VSALRSGRFSLSLAPERWLPSLAGGFMMGVDMAIAIRLQQAVTGKRMHVNCGGDYCRARL